MPIQISISDVLCSLSKGFDSLLPSDFKAMAASVEADPSDESRQLVFADWLAEHGEEDLEFGLRWCVARRIRPRHKKAYRYGRMGLGVLVDGLGRQGSSSIGGTAQVPRPV